ncbi:MAG: acylneuraminate cytidylyltransferase family protein [Bacteroidales bacterium]|nr:acylneuraminate cytidylyltransferase family protein [Bacteroidales bacterium]
MNQNKFIVLLLPMKEHSERVPNKNLKKFCGNPLYHAIIKVVLKSKYIDEIIVDTDSEEIKKDVKKNFPSVIIIDRPEKNIGDNVPMNDVIEYDLTKINGDIFIQTHSTNPMLLTTTLDNAIEKFMQLSDENDSIFSVTKIQTRLYWKNGSPINHNPQELLRTQDLPPVYEENSNFYIFTKDSFFKAKGKRIGRKPFMFEIDKIEAIDIDEAHDFIIAEQLYKQFRENKCTKYKSK